MQIRRFSLDISQNLHPAIYYINLMLQEFLLHRSIKLRRIPCCLIKILSKLIFKIFLNRWLKSNNSVIGGYAYMGC